MNTLRLVLLQVGAMFLMLAATTMIVIGIADAQTNPNKLCVSHSQSGCPSEDCTSAFVVCNLQTWDGFQRSAFAYKLCNGAVGNCVNWSAEFKVCEGRFYTRDDQTLCAIEGCKQMTTISACSP